MKARIAAAALFLLTLFGSFAPLAAATAEDYYKAGLTLTQQNQHEQAIRYYQAAAQLDANHWQAQQAMGTSYYQAGKKAEALAAFDASLKIHPENPQLKAFADSLRSQVPAASSASFSTTPVFAAKKSTSSRKWKSMGLKMALVISQLKGDDNTASKMMMGFGGGAFFTLGLSPKLAIQPEVIYMPKGGKNSYIESGYDYVNDYWIDLVTNLKIKMTYLEIPILIKYHFGDDHKQGILIGPSFGFLMGAKATGDQALYYDDVLVDTQTIDEDMKSQFKSSDLGLVIGAMRSFGKLQFETRACLGLSNVSATTTKIKNTTILISLGYGF